MHWLHPGQWPVYIGFTTCPHAFKREMKRLRVSPAPNMLAHERAGMTMHTLINNGQLCFIIGAMAYNKKQHSKEQYAALIAHEALHIIQEMQRELYKSGVFDDESAAYLLQYIVQHCLQIAWKSGGTRRIKPTPTP